MSRRAAAVGVLVCVAAGPRLARAASCHDESELPAVVNLEEHQGQLRAFLGGALFDVGDGLFPVLAYAEGDGWALEGTSKCGHSVCGLSPVARQKLDHCLLDLPKIPLTDAQARKLRPDLPKKVRLEQRVGACVESEGALWFGISFPHGRGIGGIGRYDKKTKRLQVRRPAMLRDVSVTSIAHDGARLWLGTEAKRECIGPALAEGLVVYDWHRDEARSFRGADTQLGPCGFVVHGVSWRNGGVWVATDLGLSRWDAATGGWSHLLPVRTRSSIEVQAISCEALYLRLLPVLSSTPGATADYGSAREQLEGALRAFRPGFAAAHLDGDAE